MAAAAASWGAVCEPNPAGQPLGVERHTQCCWEYGSVELLPLEPSEEDLVQAEGSDEEEAASEFVDDQILVVSAWFGDPDDTSQRRDVTREVREQLDAQLVAAPPGSAGRRQAAVVAATTRLWGDPARFRMKRLEVTYELVWLGRDERCAIEALRRRSSDKAQEMEDLDEHLSRLGAALLGAACPAASSSGSPDGAVTAPVQLGRTSPRWRQLGFQSSDPRTDLRTGRLALEALVYLAERYPLATGQMVREAQSDGVDYPFAVASINITQQLARYLGLAEYGVSGVSPLAAPRKVVRRFARLLVRAGRGGDGVDPFGELHAAAMSCLHAAWRARKAQNPSLTVMDFAPALEETMATVHRFCRSAPLRSADELRGLGQYASKVREDHEDAAQGTLLASMEWTMRSATETAGIWGTYLHGVLSDAERAMRTERPT